MSWLSEQFEDAVDWVEDDLLDFVTQPVTWWTDVLFDSGDGDNPTASPSNQPGVGGGSLTPDAFNQMLIDSSSFSVAIDSGTRNAIQWIAAKDRILIGTTGGEWRMSGHSNKPLTPFNYDLKPQTVWGSKDMQPLVLHDSVAFVDFVGKRLRELVWDGTNERYLSPDLMMLAEHITASGGVTTMAYQKRPDSIIWATLADGTLISCTYDKSQDVVAWARHPMTTGSAYSLSGGYPTLQVADGTFAVAQADPGLTQTTAISNVAELQAMQDDLTGNYYLANDIDATGFDFVPIGQGHATHTEFTGTFDGCGYTISNLTVDKYYADGVRGAGLFGAVRQGARIANLTLENVSITSDTNSGSVLGQAEINPATDDIIIQNCHASGSVTDTEGNLGTGGFVGGCWGGTTKSIYFYDCTTSCEVKMAGDFACQAGGFVGWMGNDIICQNCRATGNVEVTGDPSSSTAGGFVACDTDDTNYCIDCAATGNVTNGPDTGGFVAYPVSANFIRCSARGNVDNSLVTNQEAGGFSGWGSGVFTDCYSWGNVSVSMDGSIAGGFAPSTSGTYLNCYSIGTVDGGTTGGFVEDGTAPDSMVACFWDTESSDEASGVGYGSQPAGLVGHITSWMKTKINYERAGWDFADVWEMETLPILGVESVCVIPGSSEDEIWLTVTREINDSQVRYIERMKPRNWGTDQADCFFVDSGLTYDGDATTTFTGLDHLEGETVAILGDGAVFPTQMVTNGSVTLSESVSVCHIGLPFTYKLKPMRMDQGYNGTSKGSIKKISEAVISFYKTLNARYGDGTDTYDIDWRETDAEYTTPPDLVTGDKVVVADGGFSVEDPFQIEGSDPLPCTVRAIIPRIEVTGR